MIWLALGEYRGPLRMDVFVQYTLARVMRHVVNMSYMAYVTKSLQLAPQGYYMSGSWIDTIQSNANAERDMSADEVVDHVTARLESMEWTS